MVITEAQINKVATLTSERVITTVLLNKFRDVALHPQGLFLHKQTMLEEACCVCLILLLVREPKLMAITCNYVSG